MMQRLFVYGTLAPGRPNEHILAPLGGTWQPGSVRGRLHAQGWGAALGYPGLIPDEQGEEIRGFLFASDDLAAFWPTLDAFEGEQYARVALDVRTDEGGAVPAFVYVLKGN